MKITRRKLLKNAMIGSLASALSPLESVMGREKSKILVRGHVHKIPGDKLSDSFHKSEDCGLWKPIADKVNEFYSDNFDFEFRLQENASANNRKLDRNQIAFEYVELDNLLKEPRPILYAFGGQELIDLLESEIINAQKLEGWNYKAAENAVFGTLRGGIRETFGKGGGFGSKRTHQAWVFPSKKYEKAMDDGELINAYAFSACHEIGHTFGLEHPRISRFTNPHEQPNFMNPKQILGDVFTFNYRLDPNQVRQIERYLKFGQN